MGETENYAREVAEELARLRVADQPRSALCLSGGGIRSATFSLGVLQGLAHKGWLEKFTYLSTVSGGGYIGSWLTSWIRREGFAKVITALRAGPAGNDPEPVPIQRLRANSNYLSPAQGLSADFFALFAGFARNLVLNWAVLVPFVVAVVAVPLCYVSGIEHALKAAGGDVWRSALLVLGAGLGALTIAYTATDLPDSWRHQTLSSRFFLLSLLPVLLASVLISVACARPEHVCFWSERSFIWGGLLASVMGVFVGHGLRVGRATYRRPKRRARWLRALEVWALRIIASALAGMATGTAIYRGLVAVDGLASYLDDAIDRLAAAWPGLDALPGDVQHVVYATLAVPLLVLALFAGATLYVALSRRWNDEGAREWWARAGGCWLLVALAWSAAIALTVWIPLAAIAFGVAGWGALTGGGAGVLATLVGYYGKFSSNSEASRFGTLLEKLGVRLLDLAALVFIVCLIGSTSVLVSRAIVHDLKLTLLKQFLEALAASPGTWALVAFGAAAATILLSVIVGVNTFSIHSLYANRLTRAYLGATRPRHKREPHAFTGFDPRDDLPVKDAGAVGRPLFHVINTALNIAKTDERLEWQDRKAASFTFTPLRAGSRVTGYCDVEKLGRRGTNLGRALAISGAAATPNMGHHTSSLVAFVMTFFNVRLGRWVTHPAKVGQRWMRGNEPRWKFGATLAELFAGTKADWHSLYLSDGGHFDNTGLYEMIRRRCTRIVLVDGSCDSECHFDDLQRAVRLVRADFGVEISFAEGLPTATSIRDTGDHYAVGTINYRDAGQGGTLIYVKPGLCRDVPPDVAWYEARSRERGEAFPHQSTVDQFFDDAQFESYRALGRHSLPDDWPPWDSFDAVRRPKHKPADLPDGAPDPAAAIARESTVQRTKTAISRMFTMDALPAVLAIAGVIGVGGYQLAGPETPPPERHGNVLILWSPAEVGELPRDGHARILLPLFKEASGCNRPNKDCGTGQKLEKASSALVQRLGRQLAECDANRFTIAGYSSSSDFKDSAVPLSRWRNLLLAIRRAEHVRGLLGPEFAANEVERWGLDENQDNWDWSGDPGDFYARMQDGQFVDWYVEGTKPTYDVSTGVLNRRVELRFASLGQCTLDGLWKSLQGMGMTELPTGGN